MDFYSEFIQEVVMLLEQAEESLVAFCNNENVKENWANFTRIIHSLKGTSGFMDNVLLEKHCHLIETFLETVPDVETLNLHQREALIVYLFKFGDFAKELCFNSSTLASFNYYSTFEDCLYDEKKQLSRQSFGADILVVDDDRVMIALLKQVLDGEDWRVEYYGCPAEVFENVDIKYPPKMIVSDIHMPGMDGVEFSKKFKKEIADIPFVFITSLNSTKVFIDLVNEGGFAVIQKPIDQHKLIYNIKQAMRYSVTKAMADKCLNFILTNFYEISSFLDSINKAALKNEMKKDIEDIYRLKQMVEKM